MDDPMSLDPEARKKLEAWAGELEHSAAIVEREGKVKMPTTGDRIRARAYKERVSWIRSALSALDAQAAEIGRLREALEHESEKAEAAPTPQVDAGGEWLDQALIDQVADLISSGRICDATSNAIACVVLNAVVALSHAARLPGEEGIKRLAKVMSDAAWDAGPFDAEAGVRAVLKLMEPSDD